MVLKISEINILIICQISRKVKRFGGDGRRWIGDGGEDDDGMVGKGLGL